ncbi:hypothetical protein ACHHYP_03662 [Achlya hypogyna]|uniref:Uncharacterized protein n=1 Tax=Achlya hypogyna TaxID=1202772 RepID=A0A1V9Z3T0_ACHHY|nr:hypothetical protein ACHHYP_03662 [Achlya hypogyna]
MGTQADVAAFVLQLVQDHLKAAGLHATLRALRQELQALEQEVSSDIWYALSAAAGLPGLRLAYEAAHAGAAPSSLHMLVDFAVSERQKLQRAAAPTVVHASLRPKSASAASTPSLHLPPPTAARPSKRTGGKTDNQEEDKPRLARATSEARLRPCKASLSAVDAFVQSQHEAARRRNVYNEERRQSPALERIRRLSKVAATTPGIFLLPQIVTLHDENNAPAPSQEEDAGSHERWIPVAKRADILRRQLLDMHGDLKRQETYEKAKAVQHMGRPRVPPPDELAPVACKLCLVPFPKANLALEIPYKVIMDLRRDWDPALKELNPSMARPPACYDVVKVCVFCAQLVQHAHALKQEVPAAKPKRKKLAAAPEERQKEGGLCTDPFALDPYTSESSSSDEEKGRYIIGQTSVEDDARLVQGEVGRQLRYGVQHEHTLRNLNRGEWEVITGGGARTIFKHNSLVEGSKALSPTLRTILKDSRTTTS